MGGFGKNITILMITVQAGIFRVFVCPAHVAA